MRKINRATIVHFSPTGTVRKVALAFKDGCAPLTSKVSVHDVLTPESRTELIDCTQDTLLIFAFPVYYGRMPLPLRGLNFLKGHQTPAVIATVYGCRACEDAGREAAMELTQRGFVPYLIEEVPARHSLNHEVAPDRPNAQDERELSLQIGELIDGLKNEAFLPYAYDTATPLKPYGHQSLNPEPVDINLCQSCFVCAKLCPMGIIDKDTKRIKEGHENECEACMACVERCPKHLREIPAAIQGPFKDHMRLFKDKLCSRPQGERPDELPILVRATGRTGAIVLGTNANLAG